MNNPLLQQGLDLMIYGMGTVFVFLVLLVAVTILMSALITRCFPEKAALSPGQQESPVAPVDEHLLAILQQAIDQHLKRH
ncbi:OadG family protein [Porticoccus sp.]